MNSAHVFIKVIDAEKMSNPNAVASVELAEVIRESI